MNLEQLYPINEWQIRDPDNGLIMPYYTHPALEWIKQNINSGMTVIEFGGGHSTLWWKKIGMDVTTIEPNKTLSDLIGGLYTNGNKIKSVIKNWNLHRDIVVVDTDSEREDYILLAFDRCSKYFIVDNWQQPEVSVYSDEIVKYIYDNTKEQLIFKQPNHPTWQTAVFIK